MCLTPEGYFNIYLQQKEGCSVLSLNLSFKMCTCEFLNWFGASPDSIKGASSRCRSLNFNEAFFVEKTHRNYSSKRITSMS